VRPLASVPYKPPRAKRPGGGVSAKRLTLGVSLGCGGLILALAAWFVVGAIIGAIRGARRAAWQSYESPTGGYAVSMPGRPIVRSQIYPGAGGTVNVTVAITEVGSTGAYMVSHMDVSELRDVQDMSLDGMIQRTVAGWKGEVLAVRDVTVQGQPAKEIEANGTNQGRPLTTRLRFVAVGDMAYQLGWLGQPGKLPESDLAQFFDSFKLTPRGTPQPSPPATPPATAQNTAEPAATPAVPTPAVPTPAVPAPAVPAPETATSPPPAAPDATFKPGDLVEFELGSKAIVAEVVEVDSLGWVHFWYPWQDREWTQARPAQQLRPASAEAARGARQADTPFRVGEKIEFPYFSEMIEGEVVRLAAFGWVEIRYEWAGQEYRERKSPGKLRRKVP
jgi:hypothetical protein